MSARAPRDPRSLSPLLRPSDRYRLSIRRWGTALAALAVVVALAVGVVVALRPDLQRAGLRGPDLARAAGTGLTQLDPSRAGELRAEAGSVAASVAAGADDVGTAGADPVGTGLMAALTTLLACWTLLALAWTLWFRRLAARDRQDWTSGWERVEPGWSGRTV